MPLRVGGTNKELTIANSQGPTDKEGILLRKCHPGTLKRRSKEGLTVYTHVPVRRHTGSCPNGSQSYCSDEAAVSWWVDGCHTDIAWLLSVLITDVLYLI